MQNKRISDQVMAIYCFLDDFFKEVEQKQEYMYKVSNAAVLTTAIVAARFFYGNQQTAMDYMQSHQGLRMLEKSAFNRRLHKLEHTLEALFYYLSCFFKQLDVDKEYLIDSFPVAVCDNIRISRSRIVKGEDFRGKMASKKRYFYGFRVQLITTKAGLPVQYFIHPGAFADITALQTMDVNLPAGSHLYADSGYRDYQQEDFYRECEAIYLQVQRKNNSRRIDAPYVAFLKKHIRGHIERVCSRVTCRFPKKIHAVTQMGFILKIVLFLLAYSFNMCL